MSLSSTKRILVVDDHAVARDGLRYLFSQHQDLEICCESATVGDGLTLYKDDTPDMTIIDIALGDGSGIELVKQICEFDADAKVLVLSTYADTFYGERALRAGALGYLNKQESREKLLAAIRTVLKGQRFVSDDLSDRLIGKAVHQSGDELLSPIQSLSDRELEVFRLIGKGLTTGAIAHKLFLSRHTIDTHREKIKSKLGLKNSGELHRDAVLWVAENG